MRVDDPAPRRPLSSAERWMALGFGGLVGGLFLLETFSGDDPVRYSIGFMLLAVLPMLLVHELGHALAARLLGWRVHELVIGYGPELARLKLGDTHLAWRLVPIEGYVLPAPRRLEGARWRSALVYLAGPGAELAVVAALALALGPALWTRTADVELIAVQSLAVTGLLGAFMNLLPHAASGAASDGLGIVLSFALSRTVLEHRLALPFVLEVERHIELGELDAAERVLSEGKALHPDNVALAIVATRCQAARGDATAAAQGLEAIRARPDLPTLFEAEALHAAACMVLECNQRELLPDAEGACRAALQLSPGDLDYAITRGAVLLEQGQPRKALEVLEAAYRGARQPRIEDRCLGLLALAHHGLGQPELATRFAEALLARRPRTRLAARVRATCSTKQERSA